MDTSIVYGIIGSIHVVGFIVLLAVVKLWLKKSISGMKLMKYYIVVFLVGVLILTTSLSFMAPNSPTRELMLKYPVEVLAATMRELIGFGIGFLIVDFIILSIGRWVYKKRKKNK